MPGPYSPAVEQWRPLVERYFPPELVDKALWVIQWESGGNPSAIGDRGNAVGLYQIHHGGVVAGRPSAGQLADPETNIRFAAEGLGAARGRWTDWGEGSLYQGRPFGALGNHPYPGNNGYRPAAQAAAAAPQPVKVPIQRNLPNGQQIWVDPSNGNVWNDATNSWQPPQPIQLDPSGVTWYDPRSNQVWTQERGWHEQGSARQPVNGRTIEGGDISGPPQDNQNIPPHLRADQPVPNPAARVAPGPPRTGAPPPPAAQPAPPTPTQAVQLREAATGGGDYEGAYWGQDGSLYRQINGVWHVAGEGGNAGFQPLAANTSLTLPSQPPPAATPAPVAAPPPRSMPQPAQALTSREPVPRWAQQPPQPVAPRPLPPPPPAMVSMQGRYPVFGQPAQRAVFEAPDTNRTFVPGIGNVAGGIARGISQIGLENFTAGNTTPYGLGQGSWEPDFASMGFNEGYNIPRAQSGFNFDDEEEGAGGTAPGSTPPLSHEIEAGGSWWGNTSRRFMGTDGKIYLLYDGQWQVSNDGGESFVPWSTRTAPSTAPPTRPTRSETVYNPQTGTTHRILIDSQTGELIEDLGPTSAPDAPSTRAPDTSWQNRYNPQTGSVHRVLVNDATGQVVSDLGPTSAPQGTTSTATNFNSAASNPSLREPANPSLGPDYQGAWWGHDNNLYKIINGQWHVAGGGGNQGFQPWFPSVQPPQPEPPRPVNIGAGGGYYYDPATGEVRTFDPIRDPQAHTDRIAEIDRTSSNRITEIRENNQGELARQDAADTAAAARLDTEIRARALEAAAQRMFEAGENERGRYFQAQADQLRRQFEAWESRQGRALQTAQFAANFGLQREELQERRRQTRLAEASAFAANVSNTDPLAFSAFLTAGGGNISNSLAQGGNAVSDAAVTPAARILKQINAPFGPLPEFVPPEEPANPFLGAPSLPPPSVAAAPGGYPSLPGTPPAGPAAPPPGGWTNMNPPPMGMQPPMPGMPPTMQWPPPPPPGGYSNLNLPRFAKGMMGPPLDIAVTGDAELHKKPWSGGAKPEIVRGDIQQIIPAEQSKKILEGKAPLPPLPAPAPQRGMATSLLSRQAAPPLMTNPSFPVPERPITNPSFPASPMPALPPPAPQRYQLVQDPWDKVYKPLKRFAEGFGNPPARNTTFSGGQWMTATENGWVPYSSLPPSPSPEALWGNGQWMVPGQSPTGQFAFVPGQSGGTLPTPVPAGGATGEQPPAIPDAFGRFVASPEDQPWIDQVRGMRARVQYPQLNPYDVGYFNNLPTIRELFEKGRQAQFGVPVQDTQAEAFRYRLPGVPRSSVRQGY